MTSLPTALPVARPVVRVALLAARVGLAAVFLVAGVAKLKDPTAFATEITNYRLLPELAPVLAATLPATEVLVGAGLLAAPAAWRRASALAACALLVMFTIAVVAAVVRGINVSCGCFGGASDTVSVATILRDIVLLAAAVALLVPVAPTPPRQSSSHG